MTKEEYLAKRETLMNEAEKLVATGKIDEFQMKKKEIEELDDLFRNEKVAVKEKYENMTFTNKQDYEELRANLVNERRYEEVDFLDEAFESYAKEQTNRQALSLGKKVANLYARSQNVEGKVIATVNFNNSSNNILNSQEEKSMSVFLNKGEKMLDRITIDQESQILNQEGALADVVRGMVTGKWASSALKNAITTTATGTLIPEVLSSKVIDMARNLSLFTQAGVPIAPMDTNNIKISRIKTDPVFAFKAEGEAAKESNFELDDVTLNAKTCYGYAYVSLEAIKSSQNLESILYKVFAEAMAQAIDEGMLYGQYNTSSSTYESFAPSGIMNDASINTITATAGAGYDDIIKAIGKVRGGNGTPTVLGINSNTEELFSLLKTQDGQYLAAPKAVQDMQTIVSNQLKHDDSSGDDALVFDPYAMIIGIQNNIQIKIIEDKECLQKGLVGFQIYAMLDCKATHPKHICKVTGIKANN